MAFDVTRRISPGWRVGPADDDRWPRSLPPGAANSIVRYDAYLWRHQAMPALS